MNNITRILVIYLNFNSFSIFVFLTTTLDKQSMKNILRKPQFALGFKLS